jgi:hypothetical protein
MSNSFKILGQVAPAANVANTFYTAPANTQTIVSGLNICNQDNVNRTFSVAVVPSGNTLAAKHYIAYQANIGATSYTTVSLGVSLNANDNITVLSPNTANISFCAFGIEILS